MPGAPNCPTDGPYWQTPPIQIPRNPGPGIAPAEVVAASVKVQMPNWGGSGTCFYVDPERRKGFVCTNYHVVPLANVVVTFPDGRAFSASPLRGNPLEDITILEIDADPHTPWIPLANSTPPRGIPVWQVGYPYFSRQKPVQRSGIIWGTIWYGEMDSKGRRQVTDEPFRGVEGVKANISTASGDSGSGIFNQQKQLVAMVWGGTGQFASAVKVERITVMAQQCGIFGGRFRKRPNQPQPQQPPPPNFPPAPIQAPVDLSPLQAQLEAIRAALGKLPDHGPALKNLQSQLDGLKSQLGQLEGLPKNQTVVLGQIAGLKNGLLGELQKLKAGDQSPAILEKLHALEKQGLPLLQSLGQAHADLPAKIQNLEKIAGAVIPKVEKVAADVAPIAGTLATWLPAIGVGVPGVGILILALQIFGGLGSAKKIGTISPPTAPAASAATSSAPAPMGAAVASPPPAQAPAPLPQNTYVPVPVGNAQVAAYQSAIKKVAQNYPGMANAMKLLEDIAKQEMASHPQNQNS